MISPSGPPRNAPKSQFAMENGIAPSLTEGGVEVEIQRLQHVIDEKYRQLEEARRARQLAEDTKKERSKKIEQMAALALETSSVQDGLRTLGELLQHEKQLSEQLNPHVYSTRDEKGGLSRSVSHDLREMEECIAEKEKLLSSQIIEAERSLLETQASCLAAKALLVPLTSKPKQKKIKHK